MYGCMYVHTQTHTCNMHKQTNTSAHFYTQIGKDDVAWDMLTKVDKKLPPLSEAKAALAAIATERGERCVCFSRFVGFKYERVSVYIYIYIHIHMRMRMYWRCVHMSKTCV
jgi:hypothetical protein